MLDKIRGDFDRMSEDSQEMDFINAMVEAMAEQYPYDVEAVELPFKDGEPQVIEFHSSPNKYMRPSDIMIINSLLDKHVLPELIARGFSSFWVNAPLDVYGTVTEVTGIGITGRKCHESSSE